MKGKRERSNTSVCSCLNAYYLLNLPSLLLSMYYKIYSPSISIHNICKKQNKKKQKKYRFATLILTYNFNLTTHKIEYKSIS